MIRPIAALAVTLTLSTAGGFADTLPARRVFLELFTSQGCSSCPPAEELLEELSGGDEGCITLAYHVDYWDRLGWRDPYSSSEATARQQDYARRFGLRVVYTPQMVVDGVLESVGSDRTRVRQAIRSRRNVPTPFVLSIDADTAGGRARISVHVRGDDRRGPKWIHAATVLPEATTNVRDGENAGQRIRQVNIVRRLASPVPFRPGKSSSPVRFDLPYAPGERIVAWIQDYQTASVDQAVVWGR